MVKKIGHITPFFCLFMLLWMAVPVLGQEQGWEKRWNKILAAARREGRVTVVTSPDPVMREISSKFRARFGITVEHIAGRSSQIAGRLRFERRAKVYSVDVLMGGIGTVVRILYPEKMLEPLKPALILPEVVDPSKWKKGKLWFVDPGEQYILRVFNNVTGEIHINTDHVKPGEIRLGKDLLDPKWRGKISVQDPLARGSGSMQANRFYVQFGEEFVKILYIDQKPAVSRDRRQLADWLARGTYPISLNTRRQAAERLKEEGFPIAEIFELPDMPAIVGGSPWLLSLLNRGPNPNAARVFANWIVSKEALEIYSRGEGAATLRTDVDESFLKPEVIPRPGAKYFDDFEWQWVVGGKEKVRRRVRELLRAR